MSSKPNPVQMKYGMLNIARFGPDIVTKDYATTKASFVDKTKTPIAIFVFRYRSRQALVSSMIIPRTPSPPPIEERADLSAEEIRELQRQVKELRELNASATNVKRERPDDPDVKPTKRKRSSPGESDVLITIDEDGIRELPTMELPPRQRTEVIDLGSDSD